MLDDTNRRGYLFVVHNVRRLAMPQDPILDVYRVSRVLKSLEALDEPLDEQQYVLGMLGEKLRAVAEKLEREEERQAVASLYRGCTA